MIDTCKKGGWMVETRVVMVVMVGPTEAMEEKVGVGAPKEGLAAIPVARDAWVARVAREAAHS
jgi:hypothetical protein